MPEICFINVLFRGGSHYVSFETLKTEKHIIYLSCVFSKGECYEMTFHVLYVLL